VRALINLVIASPSSGNAGNGNGRAGATKGGLAKARRDRLAKAAENGGTSNTSNSSSQGPPPLPRHIYERDGHPPPLPPSHDANQPARPAGAPQPPALPASHGASQLSMAAQQPQHGSEYSQLHDSRSEVAEARRDFEIDAAQELPTKEAPSRSRERPQPQPHGRTGAPSAALPPLPHNQPPPLPHNHPPPPLPHNANRPAPPLPSNQPPALPPTQHLAPLAAEMVRTATGGSAGSGHEGHGMRADGSSVFGEGSEAASMHDLSLEA